jgi:peroxiredoxin
MKPRHLTVLLALCVITAASAALKPGEAAPDFDTQASLGGKVFGFSLAAARQQGPVVVYFYPAAFTAGCTVEAHEFAEASDRFRVLGATLIGVSHDNIETLQRFSVSECRGKFAVAADPDLSIARAYHARLWFWPGHAQRTSYLIAPDGKVLYVYSALSPEAHVRNILAALQHWREQQHPP